MSNAPEFPAPRRTAVKVWQWYVLVAFVLGGVYGAASQLGFSWPSLPAPLLILLAALVVTFAMVSAVLWMRDIDELARQAHYVAWFWGGSLALCVLMFLALISPVLPGVVDFAALERTLAPFAGEAGGFFAGVVASLFALTLGYGVWWIVFWLRKR